MLTILYRFWRLVLWSLGLLSLSYFRMQATTPNSMGVRQIFGWPDLHVEIVDYESWALPCGNLESCGCNKNVKKTKSRDEAWVHGVLKPFFFRLPVAGHEVALQGAVLQAAAVRRSSHACRYIYIYICIYI